MAEPESFLEQYRRIWEGHLIQFTIAKAPSTQMAKNGMYYKEFPVSFDWEHNGEGLWRRFTSMRWARPRIHPIIQRVRRFAGFYMNEDPGAANYDREAQDHPQPPQRQPWTAADAGDGIRLGRRSRARDTGAARPV